ncbi:hypothetical protein [Kitasatospora sp. MBT63]|uniref:hypothetical protein n=1 Tax=Kitasatospora sp. MBT63 TaxID=1444768 RepID=UPI000539F0A2|nr:hypothetical protein [Kitasatospora sp. MBT63]
MATWSQSPTSGGSSAPWSTAAASTVRRSWHCDCVLEFLPHPVLGAQRNDVLLQACYGQADLEKDGAWVRA